MLKGNPYYLMSRTLVRDRTCADPDTSNNAKTFGVPKRGSSAVEFDPMTFITASTDAITAAGVDQCIANEVSDDIPTSCAASVGTVSIRTEHAWPSWSIEADDKL